MGLDSFVQSVNAFAERLVAIPAAVPVLLGLATAAGLVLWLVGRRFAKPGAAALGATLGGAIGLVLGPAAGTMGLSLPLSVGLGLIAGTIASVLLNRAANVAALAAVGALALPLAAAGVLAIRPLSDQEGRAAIGQEQAWRSKLASLGSDVTENALPSRAFEEADELKRVAEALDVRWPGSETESNASTSSLQQSVTEWNTRTEGARAKLRERGGELTAWFGEHWNRQPASHRAVLVMTAVVGLAGGIVFGLVRPAAGSAASTSMFGSAMWLGGVVGLSQWLSAPWAGWLDRSAVQWLCAWAVVAALGMIVQWSGLLRRRREGDAKRDPSPA